MLLRPSQNSAEWPITLDMIARAVCPCGFEKEHFRQAGPRNNGSLVKFSSRVELFGLAHSVRHLRTYNVWFCPMVVLFVFLPVC